MVNNDDIESSNIGSNNNPNHIVDEEINPPRVIDNRNGSPFARRPAMPGTDLQQWYELHNERNGGQQDINPNNGDNSERSIDERGEEDKSRSDKKACDKLNRLRRQYDGQYDD